MLTDAQISAWEEAHALAAEIEDNVALLPSGKSIPAKEAVKDEACVHAFVKYDATTGGTYPCLYEFLHLDFTTEEN